MAQKKTIFSLEKGYGMKLAVKKTDDGSSTIFREDLKEHYHSTFGAIQEAKHVYIQAGFLQLKPYQNRILEVGFGTGLNALLTCEAASLQKKKVVYHSIEKYPLKEEIVAQLDFGRERKNLLEKLHEAEWGQETEITSYFILKKIHADLCTYELDEQYALVYYDAFSPDKQPEMWSPDILQKVAINLSTKGILTTYSTKGIVKQAFRNAGLLVKRLKGPIGKRDMLYCKKL